MGAMAGSPARVTTSRVAAAWWRSIWPRAPSSGGSRSGSTPTASSCCLPRPEDGLRARLTIARAASNVAAVESQTAVGEERKAARRWLVTGGGGFLGRHVVRALAGRGEQVVVLDRGGRFE